MVAMIQFTWILVFLAVSGVNSEVPQNGRDVDINEHPYMVSITMNGKHVCSGVILNSNSVVTSDRCVPPFKHTWNAMNNMVVVTGTQSLKINGQHILVKETFSQNHYVNPTKRPVISGVGIIKTMKPIQFEIAKPVKLSSIKVPSDAKLQMVGWMITNNKGEMTSNLREVMLTVIDNQQCQSSHEKNLTNYEFCTLPEFPGDFCKGDSGSALIYEGKLVGLATYGISCDSLIPDVHTNTNEMQEYFYDIKAI